MKLILKEEDSRPRQYWFENEVGQTTKSFFMGEVDAQVKVFKSLGIEVVKEKK